MKKETFAEFEYRIKELKAKDKYKEFKSRIEAASYDELVADCKELGLEIEFGPDKLNDMKRALARRLDKEINGNGRSISDRFHDAKKMFDMTGRRLDNPGLFARLARAKKEFLE